MPGWRQFAVPSCTVISLFPRYESYKENPSFSMLSDSEEEVLYGGKKFMYDEDEESM